MAPRLLYLTTSGSSQHLSAMACWRVPWVQEYDVHLYSNRKLSSAWSAAVQRIPARNRTITVDRNALAHQAGAMHAFVMAAPLFARYEWVVRANPDVYVLEHSAFSEWMRDAQVDAIFANCNPDIECHRACLRAIVHTDFTIFRPQVVSAMTHARMWEGNAEAHMSRLMRPVLASSNVRWLQARGYRDRSCRVRAGVREGRPTVIHPQSHRACLR